jgi:hypothetical protein
VLKPTDFTEEEKLLIKQAQLARARAGSDFMLTHLGKTVLGQTEKHHHVVEALPYTQHTIDELQDMIEQRARETAAEQLINSTALLQLPPTSDE